MVDIKKALELGIEYLGKTEYNNPMLEAKLLLAYVLGKDKDKLFFCLNETVEEDKYKEYNRLLEKRKSGYPIQYIIGTQEFMCLEFKTDENVLIPRPDTETLVENVIKIAEEKYYGKTIRILDLCTGTGAIGISLATYLPLAMVDCVDISDIAVNLARENSVLNRVDDRVEVFKSDLFSEVKREYDIIVSNPPYIETDVIQTLQTEVAVYEPKLALDGGEDGLDFYKQITKESVDYIKEDGILAFEIGYNQGAVVKALMEIDYYDVEIIKDLGENDRVVLGFKK